MAGQFTLTDSNQISGAFGEVCAALRATHPRSEAAFLEENNALSAAPAAPDISPPEEIAKAQGRDAQILAQRQAALNTCAKFGM